MKKEQGSTLGEVAHNKIINDLRYQAEITMTSIFTWVGLFIAGSYGEVPYREIIYVASTITLGVAAIEFTRICIYETSLRKQVEKLLAQSPKQGDIIISLENLNSKNEIILGDDGEIIESEKQNMSN